MGNYSKKAKALKLSNSERLFAKACKAIPGGTQTFSKAPAQHVAGVSPSVLKRGYGAYICDVDDNEYIDYMMSLGPNILGYADKEVLNAAHEGAKLGVVSSFSHPLECELAELLIEKIPCAEMVRFGKNGSDVTTAAIRVARAYNGRDKVLVCGYHGWHDWFIGSTSRNLGIPKAIQDLTLRFNYNDIDSLLKAFNENPGDIAAVIMEPVNFVEPKDDFLNKVKSITQDNGAILVFDEVITGFRMGLGGAQAHYNVIPDLACFGKAMANGYPISALVGRSKIMMVFEEVFFSGTFAGELVSIAAAIATIKAIEERDTLGHINRMGLRLKNGYNDMAQSMGLAKITQMIGFGWWPMYSFSDKKGKKSLEIQSLFQQEIVRRGIVTRAGMFLCGAHQIADIDKTLKVFEEALRVVDEAIQTNNVTAWLDGDVIQPVIRAQVSE